LTTNSLPSNPGTSQFWCLLAACARGVDYIPTVNNTSKQITSVFAADLLKGGGLPVQERLNAKLKILEDLREQGIWLLDCSIFGWYIPQQQVRSVVDKNNLTRCKLNLSNRVEVQEINS
jgi:hypothetical protein